MSFPPLQPETTACLREAGRKLQLFENRLEEALRVALGGNTALVIVPPAYPKQLALNVLVSLVPRGRTHLIRMPGHELHFEGTRGSVRIYDANHFEYDRQQKRVRGYPAGIPTFLHPEVENAT